MMPALQNPVNIRPIIIDTDLSFDDYVAILYLLQHPAVDVRAITVANGVVHVRPGVENVRRLLAFAGKPSILVAGGSPEPLSGQRSFPKSWRVILDYFPAFLFGFRKAGIVEALAVDLIRKQILASEVPVSIVALAPLTNLALALRAEPALAARIDTVFFCGGAFHVPGTIHGDIPSNPNEVSEWNMYIDPLAAEIVFKSGIRLAFIPLDVTHVHGPQPLLFNRPFVQRLEKAAKGKAAKLLVRFIHLWQDMATQYPATPAWDGVAAAIVAEPGIGNDWQEMGIRVITEPDCNAGQTVIDNDQPLKFKVCMGGNQADFESAYLNLVSGEKSKSVEATF